MVDAVLIAGPTASGKTALGIKVCHHVDGEVINADSMQVYRDLDVITARPDAEELAQVKHHLFGYRGLDAPCSVADWLADVEDVLADVRERQKVPVFVGGTGLYFTALLEGISPLPPIAIEVREKWRKLAQSEPQSLYSELAHLDPEYAAKLEPADRQRIIRGLEVMEGTGRSLLAWQEDGNSTPLIGGNVMKILLMPERTRLHERINRRFDLMVENGGLEEVRALVQRCPHPDLPVMKAIGVRELASYLQGDVSLEEAVAKAKTASRQYAKRQYTWFNNQFDASWQRFESTEEAGHALKVTV